jgi:hypothetical protein
MVAGFPSVWRHLSVLIILALSTATAQFAQAETYVAGQVGATLPQSLSDVDFTGIASGLTSSDLKLKESIMYGAKVGHYFDSAKWLGVELEAFNSTPHVKQQDVTLVPGSWLSPCYFPRSHVEDDDGGVEPGRTVSSRPV